MTAQDLSALSYSELLRLSQELDQKINAKRTEELKVLADGYVKKAQAAGFSIDEAIAALRPYAADVKASKQRTVTAAKVMYQDPQNPENTWSGRGRAARWLADYEAQGRSRDEFRVS